MHWSVEGIGVMTRVSLEGAYVSGSGHARPRKAAAKAFIRLPPPYPRMRVPLVVMLTITLAAGAAGCVTPANDDGEAPDGPGTISPGDIGWAARAVPSDDGHDHGDVAQHANLSTPNFQVLGWDPLVSDAFGGTPGGFFCGGAGTTAAGRKIAVVHSFLAQTDVAFVVMDVTDPAAPAKVGEYILERTHVYDATISLDGRFAVLGANPDRSGIPAGGVQVLQPKFRDACTGVVRAAGPEQALPLAPGVILVDLADPTAPVFADFAPTPALGPHSVHAGKVGDGDVFLASITNLEHQASYFQFYAVEELPLVGPKLALLSTYQGPPGPADPAVPLINGHVDGYIAEHPGTGQTLAYLANWDAGMIVLDISEPRAPMEIARWGGAAQGFMGAPASLGDEDLGGIHGTYPMPVLWGDRHYTFAGQELGGRPENRPTGWIFVIDTTDPAAPIEVGRWTLPVDVEWSEFLQFSTHYFTVVDRTLFVSLYHGGVWAVDVSDEALASPRSIGVWLPDRVSPSPPAQGAGLGSADMVLDVVALEDGTLLSWGSLSGAYLLRFDATRPMEAPPAWDVDADPGET